MLELEKVLAPFFKLNYQIIKFMKKINKILLVVGISLALVAIIGIVIVSVKNKSSFEKDVFNATETVNTSDKNLSTKEDIGKEDVSMPTIVSTSLSPKDMYLEYKSEYEKMKISADYKPIVLKYGSLYAIKDYEQNQQQIRETPSNQVETIFLLGKKMNQSLSDITNVEQEIRGNRAILLVTSKTVNNYKGGIGMIRESGEWKIDHEVWLISNSYFDESGKPIVNLDFNWWFNDWPANRMPK